MGKKYYDFRKGAAYMKKRGILYMTFILCLSTMISGCGVSNPAESTQELPDSSSDSILVSEPVESEMQISSSPEIAENSSSQNQASEVSYPANDKGHTQEQNLLGGMTPEDALEYMQATPDLVIVEVNNPEWKLSTGITGALHIPYTEMADRYDEIPQNSPVLLHCGGGIVSVEAYETLQERRPDIPELSYIAGAPPVGAYNEWLAQQE